MVTTLNAMPKFPPNAVVIKIAISLAAGMVVGFERESANKDVGTRTFGLTSLFATLCMLISPQFAMIGMGAVILVVAFLNARSLVASSSLEITTSIALLVTYILGTLVGIGHTFTPVAAAILMTLLLAWKVELQRFVGGITIHELRGAVLLGLIGLGIYPILPNRFIDRWSLVNPSEAWITVIVIAGIGFVNYVLLRLYSTRGLYWSAVLGGLVNSSAVVVELCDATTGPRSVALILLASAAMFIRNAVILAIFAPKTLRTAVAPLLVMLLAALAMLFQKHAAEDGKGKQLKITSPISIRRVLWFGFLFLAMAAAGTVAERMFGDLGFMLLSTISGLVSSASATAVAANLAAGGKIGPELAGTAAVLASMASAIVNLPLVFKRLAGRTLRVRLLLATAIQILAGVVTLALQHFFVFR
jgi:uncharacterized membrane protein (DUF4010 family)